MKYEVKFTNQFKKDLKLARKQNRDLDKLFAAVNMAVRWTQNTTITTYAAMIRE